MERLLMERESKMFPEEELKTVDDVLRFGLFFSIFKTIILFFKVFLDNLTITREQFK
jgi:hypothetical protein